MIVLFALFIVSLVVTLIIKSKMALYFSSYFLCAGVVLPLVLKSFTDREIIFTSIVCVILYMAVYATCYINSFRERSFSEVIVLNLFVFAVCIVIRLVTYSVISLIIAVALLVVISWKDLKKIDAYIIFPLFVAGGIFYGVFKRLLEFVSAILFGDRLTVLDINDFALKYKNGITDGAIICAILLSIVFVIWYKKKQSFLINVGKNEFSAVLVGFESLLGVVLYLLFYVTPAATRRSAMIAQSVGCFVAFIIVVVAFTVAFEKYLDRRIVKRI